LYLHAQLVDMKKPILIVSLVISLALFGCSEGGGLVPRTAGELAASPEFKLEHTTPSGVKCYVREITREMANTIPADSRDSHFLEKHKQPYLQVFVCNEKIVDVRALKEGNRALNTQQAMEMTAWGTKRGMAADGVDKAMEADAVRRSIHLGQRYY
jgi:hypothetical protein